MTFNESWTEFKNWITNLENLVEIITVFSLILLLILIIVLVIITSITSKKISNLKKVEVKTLTSINKKLIRKRKVSKKN